MVRKVALTAVMVCGCIWCMSMESGAANFQSVGPGPFKPVASVHALMHGQVGYFKKINEEMANPPSKKRNHEIEEYAQLLAELSNVNRYSEDKEDYIGWATDLRDAAMTLSKEAKKKDADNNKMQKLVQQIKGSCGACHDVYQ